MLLGPISLTDCFVFLLLLAPQLLLQVGPIRTLLVAIRALPFFCCKNHTSAVFRLLEETALTATLSEFPLT